MPAMASLSSSISPSLTFFLGGEISQVSSVSFTKGGKKVKIVSRPFSPLCCYFENKHSSDVSSDSRTSSEKNVNSFFKNFFFSLQGSVDKRNTSTTSVFLQENIDNPDFISQTFKSSKSNSSENSKIISSENLKNPFFPENLESISENSKNLAFSQKNEAVSNNNFTLVSRRKRRFLLGGCSFTAISLISGLGFPNLKNINNGNGLDSIRKFSIRKSFESNVDSFLGIGVSEALPGRERDSYDEKKLLEQNRRIQTLNQAPENFPGFIREGFDVKVVTGPEYQTSPSGLIFFDIIPGEGEPPEDGQQVIFHYVGYNESARRVDSTYLKGAPARTRLGIGGMIPGFEEGLKGMRVGGVRRMVIPPELGPPVGPSTFFSAKQFEVFDVELLSAKNCVRRQVVFYSDVVCE